MAYGPGNFRPTKSVIPKQARMGFYKRGNFRGLGDPIDWSTAFPQIVQELPVLIGVAAGQPGSTQTGVGTSQVGAAQFGYGPNGQYYGPGGYNVQATASPVLWIGGALLLAGVLWVAGRR